MTPEMIATLSDEERQRFFHVAKRLVGGESLRNFVTRITPHEPIVKHLNPIADVLEYARLKPIRIILDYGPGHAKTTVLGKGMAHWLQPDQSPSDLCAYVTYSDTAAREKNAKFREFWEMGSGLKARGGDGFWKTPQGGGIVARGSHGGLTGKRVPGILIYDDPYKDLQDARSPATNKAVIERFKGVSFTRLQGGSIVVLHTRWMMDDLIGYIVRELGWDHISVPSICDTVDSATGRDLLGRKLGEAAWPEQYPVKICYERDGRTRKVCGHAGHLEELKTTLGDWIFAAMYQGKPRPEGTQIFHEPTFYDPKTFSWNGKRGCIVIDPAATAKTSADYSVLLVAAFEGWGMNAKMWIVDVIRVQVEIPRLVQIARSLQTKYRLMIACEAVGGFKAVPQTLRAMDPKLRVYDIEATRDKFTRAQNVAAAWNDGRVMIPIDAPWASVYVDELTRFVGEGDAHDDQVDATAHAWNVLWRAAPKVTSSDYANSGM